MRDKRTVTPLAHLAPTASNANVPAGGGKKSDGTEAMGYGIERCLYELNPDLVCLSPSLIHASVLTPAEALIALETVAAQPNRPSFPIDRHLAAFLISRWKGLGFIDLQNMGKPRQAAKNLAALKILAGIQAHFKIKGLPNLCQWLAGLCAPAIAHYHTLEALDRVQEEVTRAVSSGQLVNLVRVFDSQHALAEEQGDYQAAKTEALLIESEIKEIESRILTLNRAPFMGRASALGWLAHFWFRIKSARGARKGKARIVRLYRRSENLLETWGHALLP